VIFIQIDISHKMRPCESINTSLTKCPVWKWLDSFLIVTRKNTIKNNLGYVGNLPPLLKSFGKPVQKSGGAPGPHLSLDLPASRRFQTFHWQSMEHGTVFIYLFCVRDHRLLGILERLQFPLRAPGAIAEICPISGPGSFSHRVCAAGIRTYLQSSTQSVSSYCRIP
jgi:hypothetical protein